MTEQDWLQNKVQQLENCYREVLRTSMAGMPLINPKLKIEAVDFGLLEGSMVGVLISPWFMNLMLLPGPDQDWAEQTELGKYKHSFASGQYQFIAGHKANIGHYRSCSLFSPMFDFASQRAARDCAKAVMVALHSPSQAEMEPEAKPEISRRSLLRGRLGKPQAPAASDEALYE